MATGAVSPGDIAQPLRSILRRQRNTTVLLGEAVGLDVGTREVRLADGGPIGYDSLVVASGARFSYFGHEDWAQDAPGLKSLDDALEIRRRILIAFEAAEREHDAERRAEWLTFVIVGGGPTGVELAGSLAEIARDTLRRDFRSIDTRSARILLVEALPRILPTYPADRSASARRQLERIGRDGPDGHAGRRHRRSLGDRRAGRTGPASGSRRAPSCGPPASSPRRSSRPWPRRPARRRIGTAGSWSGPT